MDEVAGIEGTYNADIVYAIEPPCGTFLCFLLNKLVKTFGAGFLHALEAETQVDREGEAERLVRLEDVEPAEDGALVVGRAAADEAASLFVDDKRKGLRVPSVALLCLQ